MKAKNTIKNILNKLPYIRGLYEQTSNAMHPNGHFYSPIFSIEDIKDRQDEIWKNIESEEISGISLQIEKQKELVTLFKKYYNEIPFKPEKQDNIRYYFNNGYYNYSEGIILYSMMREFKPKNIIEIGSGFSSALMLDTNDLFFNSSINLTFIEPFPKRLNSLITQDDNNHVTIIENIVQSVPLETFEKLEAGDILFIDSSHVCKTGSDVNYILFDILPKLKKGVFIHFHDIFNHFEYPKDWIFRGYNWNENYILRAFLMHNDDYNIVMFTNYLQKHFNEIFKDMPLLYKHPACNFWIQKK